MTDWTTYSHCVVRTARGYKVAIPLDEDGLPKGWWVGKPATHTVVCRSRVGWGTLPWVLDYLSRTVLRDRRNYRRCAERLGLDLQ